jgi:hypothetical protein
MKELGPIEPNPRKRVDVLPEIFPDISPPLHAIGAPFLRVDRKHKWIWNLRYEGEKSGVQVRDRKCSAWAISDLVAAICRASWRVHTGTNPARKPQAGL